MHYVPDHGPPIRPPAPPPVRDAASPSRPPLPGLAALAVLAWLATGLYTVQPNEQAAVRRFGRLLPEPRGPGLHLGLPAGLDRVTRVRLHELRRAPIGAPAGARLVGRESTLAPEHLAGDRNLVRLSGVIQYRVEDLRAFLFAAADLPAIVGNLAAAALGGAVAGLGVDDLLTVARTALQEHVRAETQSAADALGLGVRVAAVTLEEIAPPVEVAEAFRDVAAAREDRQRTVNEAEGYANRVRPQARGEADRLRLQAQGEAADLVARARGGAEAFRALAREAAEHRELVARRLALETAEAVLPGVRKIVLDPEARRRADLILPPPSP